MLRSTARVPVILTIAVLAILASLATRVAAIEPPEAEPSNRPNIVFILVDDLGWRDLGCYGNRWHETPAIDTLASEGMRFTHAYANAPNCAPSRASLITGLYTPRHRIFTVGRSTRGASEHRRLIPTENTTDLDPALPTLPRVLRKRGYTTCSIGKWHLGDDPREHGFDIAIAGSRAGSPRSYFSPYRNPTLEDGADGEYLVNRMTSEALSFIEDHHDAPFFLYLSHFAVHTPMQAPDADTAYFNEKPAPAHTHNARYAAMLRHVDNGVGRIMSQLDRLGLADNTLVIFFSDNGGHGAITSMEPLRGSKGMLYEGGIRVPLIVRWPHRIAPGTISTHPVIGVDFLPTILDLTGGRENEGIDRVDGASFVSTFDGQWDARMASDRTLFWHFPAYLEAYRGMDVRWRTTPAGAVRQGRYKLIEFFEDGRLELYDLLSDPGERHDLAATHPDVVASMHRTLRMWRTRTKALVPDTPNPEFVPDAEAERR